MNKYFKIFSMLFSAVCISFALSSAAQAACISITPPTVINSSGSYCISRSTTSSAASGYIIEIRADNVTLDFAGYSIISTNPTTTAKAVYAIDRKNISVVNGKISGFEHGIHFDYSSGAGQGHVVENMDIDSSSYAIEVYGRGSIVRNNHVVGIGGSDAHGIYVRGNGVRIINNDVYDYDWGIYTSGGTVSTGDGNIIDNNRIGSSVTGTGYGISNSTPNAIVTRNVITNMSWGIRMNGGTIGIYQNNLASSCTTAYDVPISILDGGTNLKTP